MLLFFPVASTWLFALWWLGIACWDCCACSTSPRYCNQRAVALALLASGQSALVGAFLLREAPAFLAWGILGTSGRHRGGMATPGCAGESLTGCRHATLGAAPGCRGRAARA